MAQDTRSIFGIARGAVDFGSALAAGAVVLFRSTGPESIVVRGDPDRQRAISIRKLVGKLNLNPLEFSSSGFFF